MTNGARGPGPFDVLVLGSGVAGLTAAVRLAGPGATPALSLGVLTKGALSQSATRWAQGGVAAVLGGDEDSTDLHLADTLAAGAGLCDEEAVRILVDEGPGRVHELIALGVEFDRESSGLLALAREGGHSRARVVHAGGAATGAEVERALVAATWRSAGAVLEAWFALDLIVEGGRCVGVTALPPGGDEPREVRADHVVLATGGLGQLFASPPTRPSRPATAWPWRCAPGFRWPMSSSCSSTRPRCTTRPCPDRCSPRRCAATAPCCATPVASASSTSSPPATWSAAPWRR